MKSFPLLTAGFCLISERRETKIPLLISSFFSTGVQEEKTKTTSNMKQDFFIFYYARLLMLTFSIADFNDESSY
jgi:hypothetical protein